MDRFDAVSRASSKAAGVPGMSTIHRIGREYVAQIVAFLVAVADRLFIPAVLIRYLGVAEFSVWSIAIATGAFISVLEFGLTRYYSNRQIFYVERGELDEARRTYQTGTTMIAALVVVSLAVILWGYPFLVDGIGDAALDRELPLVVIPVTLAAASLQLLALRQALYRAHRHFTAETVVRLLGEIARISVVIMAAIMGAGLLLTAWLWFAATIAFVVLPIGIHTYRRYPEFRERPLLPDRSERKEAMQVSPGLWMQSMFTTLYAAVPVIVIGALTASPLVISQFVLMRTIANFVRQVQQMFANLFAIELARRAATGDHQGHATVFGEANRLLGIQAAVASAVLIVFGQDLFSVWTGQPQLFDIQLLVLAIAPPLLIPTSMMAIEALAYANRPWPIVRARIAQLAISIVLFFMLPLTDIALRMMAALALGELAGLGLPLIFAIHRLNPAIGKRSIAVLTLAVLTTVAMAMALLRMVAHVPIAAPLPRLAFALAIGVILALAASYWLGLSSERRKQARAMMRSAFPR